jgi:hypothetical protein
MIGVRSLPDSKISYQSKSVSTVKTSKKSKREKLQITKASTNKSSNECDVV